MKNDLIKFIAYLKSQVPVELREKCEKPIFDSDNIVNFILKDKDVDYPYCPDLSYYLECEFDLLAGNSFSDNQIIKMEKLYLDENNKFESRVVKIISNQCDDVLISSLTRLTLSTNMKYRNAALKILLDCKRNGHISDKLKEFTTLFNRKGDLTESEKDYIERILSKNPEIMSLFDLVNMENVNGINNLLNLLRGLQNDYPLESLTSKLKISSPDPDDTKELFNELIKQYEISEDLLIKLAFISPQWNDFIEFTLGMEGLSEAIEWFREFDKTFTNRIYSLKSDFQISRSFHNYFPKLGNDNLEKILLSNSKNPESIHRLCSVVLRGNVSFDEWLEKVDKKNWEFRSGWDYPKRRYCVRFLGMFPLPVSDQRQAESSRRYQLLQDTLRKVGYKESDRDAVINALTSLADNAGFSDYEKFELAMEAEAVKDLANGPDIVEIDDFQFSLSLTELGEPVFESKKNGIRVRTIPKKYATDEQVKKLKERAKQIKKQTTRLRRYLEGAMCSRKPFNNIDLQNLLKNPILSAIMSQIVFISPKGMGYLDKSGKLLHPVIGEAIPVNENDVLIIAHPCEMLTTGKWHLWQHDCFVNQRVQPFKQIFREVYVVTDAERNESHESQRFYGHRVDLNQALSLFHRRGWEYSDYGSSVKLKKNLSDFQARTLLRLPHSIENLEYARTCEIYQVPFEEITFHKSEKIPLQDIPPLFFSEAMRDIDLVVSVAYSEKGAWEGTYSTIQSRAALVKEICTMMKLGNVRVDGKFVIIDGSYGAYKVHLGSGSIHKVPGNYVCVVPDNTKVEGKLFLPFVDKDQMTSIILSKVILLAHDEKIKDPVILRQITRSN